MDQRTFAVISDDRTWASSGDSPSFSESGGGARPEEHAARGEWIERAIAGDPEAQRRVWHEHRRWVAAVLLAHKPRTAELDDLLQEVAVAVVAKISSVRDAGAFKPWLRAVAISIAKTTARRGNVRKAGWLRIAGFAGREESDRVPAGGNGETLREGRRLMELAADLPDGYREPLLLKCVQGMSYRQIGEVMGLPETTIETRIARGRRMLRERATDSGIGASSGDTDAPTVSEVVSGGAKARV